MALSFFERLFSYRLLLSKKSQEPDFFPSYKNFLFEKREQLFSYHAISW